MCTYVFPGQGSQIKGMGKNLFTEFPDLVQKAEDILGYSVIKLCLENPNGELNKTQYTQSALYLVNVLSYLKKIQECPQKPDYLAGHSLGEYNALFAAGVFVFDIYGNYKSSLVIKADDSVQIVNASIAYTSEGVYKVLSWDRITETSIPLPQECKSMPRYFGNAIHFLDNNTLRVYKIKE